MSKLIQLDYASTHRDIVERCKENNRQAQFELYSLYSKAMYNICLRMLRNETDAEDLLQRTFIDVFTKLHTFKYQSSIGAWIKRITINNCINFLKRNRVFTESFEPRHASTFQEEPRAFEASDGSLEKIHEAINQLPDGYRVVFSLYLLEGYDHKEIADILDISEATSKSQYSRAKKKLRELIDRNEFTAYS